MAVKRLKALCTVPRNYLAIPVYITKNDWKTSFMRFALPVSSGGQGGDTGQGITEKRLHSRLPVSENQR